MTELVCNDSLELFTVQVLYGAAGDTNGGIRGGVACCKSIDTQLVVQNINFRNRHAGGDGHLFHHVAQLALIRIAGVGWNKTPAQSHGYRFTTMGKLKNFEKGGDENSTGDQKKNEQEKGWIKTACSQRRQEIKQSGRGEDAQAE